MIAANSYPDSSNYQILNPDFLSMGCGNSRGASGNNSGGIVITFTTADIYCKNTGS